MTTTPLYPADFRAARVTHRRKRHKNPRTVTTPDRGVSPHVKLVFAEMARLHVTYDELEVGSGVRRPTVKQWRRKNRPSLESLEAVLGFLGWSLCPVPALETLTADTAGELVTIAKKLDLTMPQTMAALIAIGVEQKLLCMSAEEKHAALAEREARNPRAANDNTPRRRRRKNVA
ncbi:hypothetical protein [Nitrobacter sp.]|uniref:hypothetical protein n=1 Tax=Nitrobacter sp. TaxID=29420 RepID=UPI003F64E423